jgi:hypothetical protein
MLSRAFDPGFAVVLGLVSIHRRPHSLRHRQATLVCATRPLGIEGVAWGTTLPNLLFNTILAVYVCRLLGVSVESYLRRSFLTPLAVTAFLVLVWSGLINARHPSTWFELLLVCASGTAAYLSAATLVELGPRALISYFKALACRLRFTSSSEW